MKIRRVLVRTLTTRYERTFHNARYPWTEKHAVLAFVETASGVTGVGEAWCDAGVTASVVALLEGDLAPKIVGHPVHAPERLFSTMFAAEVMSLKGSALYSAISALDTAVWDAYARHLGQPLRRILGGFADRIPVYGSGGLYVDGKGPDALARDMATAMERGFCGVKIKVAGAPTEVDVARATAVREAIGAQARLMVDALFAPTVPQAKALGHALAPLGLYFYEAPTDRHDVRGWVDVRADTGLALSGPEVESGLHRFRTFLEANAVDYLQADTIICGGISEARRIAALAAAFRKPLTMHASGSAVGFAANAQIAAAFECGDSVEHHLLHQALFDRLWEQGWSIADGSIVLPERPGIGIELQPDDPALDA